VWQARGVRHADSEGFFDYGGDVGEGLDVLAFIAYLEVGEYFGAEEFISVACW